MTNDTHRAKIVSDGTGESSMSAPAAYFITFTRYGTWLAGRAAGCKVATLKEVEAQGWSLNPGRYVGVADKGQDDFDFAERLEKLSEELEVLNSEARELEERIAGNVAKLLEAAT